VDRSSSTSRRRELTVLKESGVEVREVEDLLGGFRVRGLVVVVVVARPQKPLGIL